MKVAVEWATKIYVYSALGQFREVVRSILLLIDAEHVPAIFFCCRGAFELAAHSYFVKKRVIEYLDQEAYEKASQFLFETNMGSRELRQDKPDHPTGPHIGKVMKCFNEYFVRGQAEQYASKTYSFLSEYSHPNSFAFANHFEWTKLESVSSAQFSKPSIELVAPILGDALACIALVDSDDRLLRRVGDAALQNAIRDVMKVISPSLGSGWVEVRKHSLPCCGHILHVSLLRPN